MSLQQANFFSDGNLGTYILSKYFFCPTLIVQIILHVMN